MGSIMTLLVVGVAGCAGTHRKRFRQALQTRQRPTVGWPRFTSRGE